MRIQHNIAALNAHAKLGVNQTAQSKNLEKLSSGYRINRAGDDAAGLAISEKMRGQIRGLNMANKNAQDGISLIQTAEGGLQETHDILQRMRELAVQSANGTYQDEVDRENINKEVNALKSEIDRISTSTHYNGINLLDGSLSANKKVGGTADVKLSMACGAAYAKEAATKGKFVFGDGKVFGGTANGANDVTIAAKDKFEVNIHYEDESGKLIEKKINLTVSDDGKSILTDNGVAIKSKTNGTVADTFVESDLMKGIAESLSRDKDFSEKFKVTTDGTTNAIVIENKEAGAATHKVRDISFVSGDGKKAKNVTLDAQNSAAGNDSYVKIDTTDAGAVSKMKVFSADTTKGTTTDLNDAIFEINGKKFAFVGADTDAAEMLNKYGVHTVNAVANAKKIDNAEAAAMAEVIKQETGLDVTADTGVISIKSNAERTVKGGEGLTFQIGANGVKDQRVSLNVEDMSSKGIGVDKISLHDRPSSNDAIDIIDKAINIVSGTRADLGALQNRLEHTTKNLTTTAENLQAAEARIRDVDMAREMMEFTKNNILSQAAQTMLAQANQQPQGVLQLLQ